MITPNTQPVQFTFEKEKREEILNRKTDWSENPIGLVTLYRTYLRSKENGNLETWNECVLRVIEGMFTVQKTYIFNTGLIWDEDKAQRTAYDAAIRLFEFKWTPPGRGLWMMGTKFMWDKGGAALNNPLSLDTNVLTKEYGWIKLGDIEDASVTVLSNTKMYGREGCIQHNPVWTTGILSEVENHPCKTITVVDKDEHKTEITASNNHRWFRRRYKGEWERVTTEDLKLGDYLPTTRPSTMYKISEQGIQHGLFFGDGTRSNGELHQFDDSCELVDRYFVNADYVAERHNVVRQCPYAWGELPDNKYRADKRYLYGFLAGYFAADGHVTTTGVAKLNSARLDELEAVANLFREIGIRCTDPKVSHTTSNLVEDRNPLYEIRLTLSDLDEKFFLKTNHKQNYIESSKKELRRDWVKVVSIEFAGNHDVRCLTVPEYEQFVIDGFVLTSNCGFTSTEHIDKEGSEPFRFLMDMSMLGVGVGFDTKGHNKVEVKNPNLSKRTVTVTDDREGWVRTVGMVIDSYLVPGQQEEIVPDTTLVRAYGTNIKGFGGVASGPLPLIQGINGIKDILNKRIGQNLTSVDITDINNIIGKIVVAGNVRRCLPKDTLVHTETGLRKIQEVQVGENVYTSSGLYPVAENVAQGIQSLWSIETQLGKFECTNNHRVAVMDTPNSYIWKRAFELMPEDKLVFPCNVIEGTKTSLPEWHYDYPDHSTTCSPITIPELDADIAWFIGVLHGDGYVFTNRSKGGANAGISIAVHADDVEQKDKVVEQIKRFGVNVGVQQPKTGDNCFKIRVASKQLAWYLEQFKKPNVSIDIPECILQGKVEIRLAYLAGVLDADGCVKNKPISSCVTVYKKFADQLQNLYASVGIPARTVQINSNEVTEKGWQTKYSVNIVGQYTKNRFSELLSKYSFKIADMKEFTKNQRSFGFPAEWIEDSGVKYMGKWAKSSKQMTLEKYRELGGDAPYIPIEVISIEKDVREDETFDLSVPEAEEFVCGQGILVHNTAEIAFAEPNDHDFRTMKSWKLNPEATGSIAPSELEVVNKEDYDKYNENPYGDFAKEMAEKYKDETWAYKFGGWRWTSNNSLFAKVGMDYTDIAESIAENGEPGLAWLENMQQYSRMVDPPDNKDHRAMGGNPSLRKGTLVYTTEGIIPIDELEDKNFKVVNHKGDVSDAKCFLSGRDKPLYRLGFSGQKELYATPEHEWAVVQKDGSVKKVRTDQLESGMKFPKNPIDSFHFGNNETNEDGYGLGVFFADGWLSQRKTGENEGNFVVGIESCDIDQVESVKSFFERHMIDNNRSINIKTRKREGFKDTVTVQSSSQPMIHNIMETYGMNSKDGLPSSVWSSSDTFVKGFLKGLFSTDGNIDGNRLCLTCKHEKTALDVCKLLGFYGINANLSTRSTTATFPNGKDYGGKIYTCYYIRISNGDAKRFVSLIGLDSNMVDKLEPSLTGEYKSSITLKSVELTDLREDVWDITVYDDTHTFATEYCITGNCLEQTLEPYELCCLVETYPSKHKNAKDYYETLKVAYLYAKTVTLLATHNPRTNTVMCRNRRIGCSQSGVTEAISKFGRHYYQKNMLDSAYEVITNYDIVYSDWLGVPRSIKMTSIKPSGTVSLLANASPGVHFPKIRHGYRTMRMSKDSPLVKVLRECNYRIEASNSDPYKTVVVYFPVIGRDDVPTEADSSIWEQFTNAVMLQKYWADNQVSCTISFKPNEIDQIAKCLSVFDTELKGISLLPLEEHGYKQAPYIATSKEEATEYAKNILPLDFSHMHNMISEGENAESNKFCDSSSCEI